MKIIYGIKELSEPLRYPVATLGMFDGVHRGHQKVIESVKQHAQKKGGTSIVITFDQHPRNVIKHRTPSSIISLKQRLSLFQQLGVDYTVVLKFDQKLSQMPAEDFIRKILVQWLGVQCLILGFDSRFGKDREGDITLARKLGIKYDFEVYECPPVRYHNEIVSSTAIRQAILEGDLKKAEDMLGRPVSIMGTVVEKSGRGKILGYPTANLKLHHEVRPPRGVYGTRVRLGEQDYLALTNIGLRPTFSKDTIISKNERPEIEVNILDFQGSLYGQDLEIQFLFKIRDEIRFSSAEELKAQIEKDREYLLKRVSGIRHFECKCHE